MKYFSGRPVLARAEHTEKSIAIDWEAVEDDVLFGGSPIDENGRVVNDSTAVGILAYNVWRGRDLFAPVIIGGYIDIESAQENCGFEISDEAKSAMPNMWFSDAGPRGGSSVGAVSWNELEDKPFGEVSEEQLLIDSTEIKFNGYDDELLRVELTAKKFEPSGKNAYEILQPISTTGTPIRVVFDGVDYVFPNGFELSGEVNEGIPTAYLGNRGLDTDGRGNLLTPELDNGQPFLIRVGYFQVIIWFAEGDRHTVSMYCEQKAIKPLDPEFGGVPTPTAEDEGKVLTVENGEAKWKNAGANSESNVLCVVIELYEEFVVDGETKRYITCNTKFAEIQAAWHKKAVLAVEMRRDSYGGESYEPLSYVSKEQNSFLFGQYRLNPDDSITIFDGGE